MGNEAPDESEGPAISADGRYVAFYSWGQLAPADLDSTADVYVHDRTSGVTAVASVKSGGVESSDFAADPSISGDGRLVAFDSDGTFAAADGDSNNDVYVRNMATGKTVEASVRSDGSEVSGSSTTPQLSSDGRFVVFRSIGRFVQGDHNNDWDLYVHNLVSGRTSRVTVRSDGSEWAGSTYLRGYAISADGSVIAFQSFAHITPGDAEADADIFVRNRRTGRTTRVSVGHSGADVSLCNTWAPVISGSGRFVAFATNCSFSARDSGKDLDVYVKDRRTGRLRMASLASDDQEVNGTITSSPSISADGRFVGFSSMGQFTSGDVGNDPDVFVRDREAGETARASLTSAGVEVNGQGVQQGDPSSLSRHAEAMAFRSYVPLVLDDTNHADDIYVRAPLF
jgi:Tol biopolymer transport system component